jgi:hypothetical protein
MPGFLTDPPCARNEYAYEGARVDVAPFVPPSVWTHACPPLFLAKTTVGQSLRSGTASTNRTEQHCASRHCYVGGVLATVQRSKWQLSRVELGKRLVS